LEQEELKKRDASRHEKMHSRRRDMVVTIDFAGRRVVEEVDEGSLDAARNRFVSKNDTDVQNQRHLDNMQNMTSSSSSSLSSSSSSSSSPSSSAAAAEPNNSTATYEQFEKGAGMFKNDTLSGRSREVVESLTLLFESLQQKNNNLINGQQPAYNKGDFKASQSKKTALVSQGKNLNKASSSSSSSSSVEELGNHLAPWRKNADHKPHRVNFDYE
jgi:hypothetical protein